jgi:hypothetical protein
VEALTTFFTLSGVDVGAIKKIISIPYFFAKALYSFDSSTVRSGKITPETSASFAS